MARPLRIGAAVGWHHVAARGIERRAISDERRDHQHFTGHSGGAGSLKIVRVPYGLTTSKKQVVSTSLSPWRGSG